MTRSGAAMASSPVQAGGFELHGIADLAPDERNPRTMSGSSQRGLRESIELFGDISGIVWNRRSGRLVCGHQRMAVLRSHYGAAALNLVKSADGGTAVETPDHKRFLVRVVDWDDDTAALANLTANNPAIQGTYTDMVNEMVRGLEQTALAAKFGPLRIDKLPKLSKAARDAMEAAEDAGPVLRVWDVHITCNGEAEQRALYEELSRRGMRCRLVTY